MAAKSWLERVRADEPFEMFDPDFLKAVLDGAKRARAFNEHPDPFEAIGLLPSIFGRFGENSVVLPRLSVDVGFNIEIGTGTFINANATLLDTYPIKIGDHVQVGPNCGFYPVGHPVQARGRAFRDPASGEIRSITSGKRIVVEDFAWIGGHVVILPGVTIGARSVIAAGSVVTKSVPPDVVAAGNPCRVLKAIDNSDFVSPF